MSTPGVASLPDTTRAESSAADGENPKLAATRRKYKKRARNGWIFLAFAGPNIALILLFIYYPLVMNGYYSTLDWRLGSSSAKFVGFKNYIEFFTSPKGVEVWRVTIIFTVVTVLASMILGLIFALVLNRGLPGTTFSRTVLFSPYVLSGVGVGIVWNFVFDPRLGILRYVFQWFGQKSPEWFQDPTLTLMMVIIVYVWKNLGFCTVIFVAGLQSIPTDLIEAAQIDGASSGRRFFSIVLPLLSPTVFFLTISTILSSMQAFDILRIMNPSGRGTNTIIFEIYQQSFGAYQRAGYAAAISVVLVVVLFAITAVQMRYVEGKVHYE